MATRVTRRHVAAAALVAVIVGALTPSYLHLADWWRPMMPVRWQSLAYVAALVTEAAIVACGFIRAAMSGGLSTDGRRMATRLETAGVIAAVYVNARWAALRPGAPALAVDTAGMFGALDIVAGAAMLPVVAAAAFEVLGHVLAWGEGVTHARQPRTRATATRPAPATASPAPRTDTPPAAPATGRLAHDAAVAAAWGVSPRTARDWRAKGDPRYGQRPEARAA